MEKDGRQKTNSADKQKASERLAGSVISKNGRTKTMALAVEGADKGWPGEKGRQLTSQDVSRRDRGDTG